MVKYLTPEDVLRIHYELVDFFENDGDPISPPGHRDMGLVEMACNRPKTGLGDVDKYKTIDEKGAALLHSLVKNHAFHNGNKRTALVSTVWFLDQNNRRLEATDDELFELVTSIADGHVPGFSSPLSSDEFVQQIRTWLNSRIKLSQNRLSSMRTVDFLEKVKTAGGSYREAAKGGSWIVFGPGNKNVRINKSTKELDGSAIRKYIKLIELNERISGVSLDEFQSGIQTSTDLIKNLITVLRRLAFA